MRRHGAAPLGWARQGKAGKFDGPRVGLPAHKASRGHKDQQARKVPRD
jgi:hypothetical protein